MWWSLGSLWSPGAEEEGKKILRVAMLITQALAGPGGGFLLPFSVDLPTESLTQEY